MSGVVNVKSKKIRGRIYNIFPVEIDIYGVGAPVCLDTWEWKYFGWFFHFTNWTLGMLLGEDNLFTMKINKKDFQTLSDEEKRLL